MFHSEPFIVKNVPSKLYGIFNVAVVGKVVSIRLGPYQRSQLVTPDAAFSLHKSWHAEISAYTGFISYLFGAVNV